MAKQAALLQSFNAGEWSPLMSGRVDLDKYGASCRTMLNFLPTPQGAAIARNGTAYVVAAADADTPSALLPFQFSSIQSCVLEFGNFVLRFITENGLLTNGSGQVYNVATPYGWADVPNIRYAQKNDIMYLFCAGYPVYKLSRFGATNWTLAPVNFVDGPYLDVNADQNPATPLGIGGAPKTDFQFTGTDNGTQNGSDANRYDGTGTGTWQYPQAVTLDGYQMLNNNDTSVVWQNTTYTAKDMLPSSWVLYGSNDNSTWTAIDRKTNYVNYISDISDWFTINAPGAYKYYKLEVSQTVIGSASPCRLSDILTTSTTDAPFGINFENTTNINFGTGFVAGDVGRALRFQRSDGVWVPLIIASVVSPTQVFVNCQGAPLADTNATNYWRLGIFCETNGYPACGAFFTERLWLAAVTLYPDTVVASEVGGYETFQPNDPRTETVTDSDAINISLESRSQVLWITSDDRGLVMGTAAGEWTIQSGTYANYTTASTITPTSILARSPTQRGSANVDAVRIDHQIMHVQRSGHQLRACAYSFNVDGYTSTALSTQASHLGVPSIVKLVYQAEPYSTIWCIRSDGVLLSFTYMSDESVAGWAQHDVGGFVESAAVIPSPDSQQDTLWLSVRRTINGQTVRYIERMLRLWDFDMTNMDAAFVDCCTVDTSKSQNIVYAPLAGQTVYALVDGTTPVGPLTADAGGNINLGVTPTVQAIVGLPMTAQLETQRLEAGAQNGTAQGKKKRIDQIIANFWATGSGTVGMPASLNQPNPVSTPIQFSPFYGISDMQNAIHDFQYDIVMPPGYDRSASILITRRPIDLLPLNVVCITVFVNTEDAEG